MKLPVRGERPEIEYSLGQHRGTNTLMHIFNEESLRKHEVEYIPFWKSSPVEWTDVAAAVLLVAFIGVLVVIFSVV